MNIELSQKSLIHKEEKHYFIFALIVSIISYILLIVSVAGIGFYAFLTALSLFLNRLMIAQIRVNGVRLSSQQFPEIFEKVIELCSKMEIKKVPDVYVIESGGTLNAFATKFLKRNMVVLYSDVFDLINSDGDDELSFIIAHELAHIKRNHITKQFLILPAMWVPLLGEAYSRACEYTCDRIAANYIQNKEAAMNGLTMLAIGKSLFKKVNRSEYLIQASSEKGFYVWIAEKISTHPPLPKRINEIQNYFSGLVNPIRKNNFKWALVGMIIVIIAVIGFVAVGTSLGNVDEVMNFANSFLEDINSDDDSLLMTNAVLENDINKVQELLDSGINPDIQDFDGWTPLMWAAQDNNVTMINLLIEAGADPNLQDYYEETALIQAVYQDNVEAINALITLGADPNMTDSTGYTPLMLASSYGTMESAKALLQSGADPNIEDSNNYTAFLYAKKSSYNEIADLIKGYSKN